MRWTKIEIELIKKEYIKKGDEYISKIINKSPNAVRIKASRLGFSKLKVREQIKLSKKEEQIIIGGLMGDLYCEIAKTCKNARLEGGHCKEQEDYLLWKISLIKNLSFNVRISKNGSLFFESKSYPCLNYYYNLFYKNGKKEVNEEILEKIDEFGLAIWYMDDGSYGKRDKNCNIHTNGFSYNENMKIKKWFKSKWKIYPKISTHKEKLRYPGRIWYFLNFNVNETRKLVKIIKDYIHPCMKYKIGCIN